METIEGSRYAKGMSAPTPTAVQVRAALMRRRSQVGEVLARYGATNLRMFGSVARGDASEDSDLDLLVDLAPAGGNELLRVAGLSEELSDMLDLHVDVVAPTLLRNEVSSTALANSIAI